jgi:hypothetical protein
MRILVATLVLVFGLSGQVKAEKYFHSGNDLLEICTPNLEMSALPNGGAEIAKVFASKTCSQYILGVMDSQYLKKTQGFCDPPKITTVQAHDIVKNYLTKHPESRQGPAAKLVIRALAEAWPCK